MDLMAELIEKHDRSRFELIAFSFGPERNDKMRRRLMTSFENFIDVRNKSNKDVALLSRNLEVDIAVDLMGLHFGARTGIFALRAAPIQINYLGYTGTMGAEYIDYIIADPIVIPEESKQHLLREDCLSAKQLEKIKSMTPSVLFQTKHLRVRSLDCRQRALCFVASTEISKSRLTFLTAGCGF